MMQTNKKMKKRKDQKLEDKALAKDGTNLENKPLQKEQKEQDQDDVQDKVGDVSNQPRILVFRWILNKWIVKLLMDFRSLLNMFRQDAQEATWKRPLMDTTRKDIYVLQIKNYTFIMIKKLQKTNHN